MLTETRRNREMSNQIARKVFYNQSYKTKVAPVGPEVSMIEWECERVTIRFGFFWLDEIAARVLKPIFRRSNKTA